MDNTYVLIPKKKALSLLENNAKLMALESGGVDNWSWYGESLWDYLKEYFGEDNDEEVECVDFSDIAEDWITKYREINLDTQLLTDLAACKDFYCCACSYQKYDSRDYKLRCIHKLIEDIYKSLLGNAAASG